MKIQISSSRQRRRGVALILTVLFLVFVSIFLASYLFLAQGEYLAVTRSQTWNTSLVLAEAGVEDALAFINQKAGVYGAAGQWTNSVASNGWVNIGTSSNAIYYLASRSPDTNLGYYSVYVTNTPSGTNRLGPAILAIGTARWNNLAGPKAGGSNVMLSFQGDPVRKIFVQTVAHSQLGGGIIAYSGMDFKGNNVTIDSYNSTRPTNSIWQTTWLYHGEPFGYWDSSLSFDAHFPPARTANVIVATDKGIINVGNANIAGYVATGPGGTVEVGSKGSVGDLYWAFHNSGLQAGRSQDDVNRSFFSYSLPDPKQFGQTSWWPVPAITTNIGGVTYRYLITNRLDNSHLVFYAINSLSDSIFINASNVVLYLTNGLTYAGGDYLTLNTNADVQLWSTGDINTVGGGSINNFTLNAHAFSIYDVSGHPIDIKFTGNGAGTGLIYAPSSDLQFAGGGSGTYDVVGAIFCNSIQINGKYNFHFDESLSQNLPVDQYTLTAWQEIP
jgi:hypothetical protein